MRLSQISLAAALLLAASAPAWAEESGVVDNTLSKMGHVIGAEKWDLKVMERHAKLGKPIKEMGRDGENHVERNTDYYGNGQRKVQQTREFVGTSDVVGYDEKNEWSQSGKPTYEFRQTSTFANGVQTGGDGWQKDYNRGKETKEIKRRWTVDAKDWKDFYVQTSAYYPNGDLKEKITEEVDTNAKTRESWGSKKASGGRNKSTQTWNGEAKRWD